MNGIYNIMYQLFGIESVTLSIIIITVVIYMCLLPLTIKQQKFSKLSQRMQPEINAIQEKYKGKQDMTSQNAMNQEMQLVYQKYGVSPMGTCLPMLIQMPLLFALYRVFYNIPAYIESIKDYFGVLRSGEVVSGSLVDIINSTSGYQDKMTQLVTDYKITSVVTDFSSTDPAALNNYIVDVLYKLPKSGWENIDSYFTNIGDAVSEIMPHINKFNYLFGMNISDTPWNIIKTSFGNHLWGMMILALLVPVLSYLTQLINIKMMPTPDNGSQNDAMARQMKTMNMMMPLVSLFFCFTVPVGLGIYWIFSAVVRAVQQFFINKHIKNLDLEDVIAKNQEKAKQRREKLGITEEQMRQAAQMNTRSIGNKANLGSSYADKEIAIEKANAAKENAKAGSLASKANLVKDFNERNNRK
ncbi:MAG: YidC/Oxa1 family membrane protein insertase [Muribaculaceae bacterium]|nr:YidC/Oxa1 family membrane protein insertase [Muribaculaceae bacterium]MCM1492937.1 YidC/Oxa1 family membrane protein insertase [Muribaculaceae bacterium]